MRGSYIPAGDLKEVRDLVRYRVKTVQARTSEIQRLQKTLESAGIKLDSVVSDITGMSSTAMIEALIDGERRGGVLADLALGRMRTAGKLADLSMALTGRFTDHHALMCRLHLDRISMFDDAVGGLDAKIAPLVARYPDAAALLRTLPGFGEVVAAGWLGAIGPAPHRHFGTAERLASWVTLCPGNYISARKSRSGRTGDGGNYIKPLLVQAAWAAIRVPGRLQARFHRLVRKFGGPKNKGAETGDHRDRAYSPQDRLRRPQDRQAVPGTRRRFLRPPRVRPGPRGIPAAAAAETQPRLRHHHHSAEAA